MQAVVEMVQQGLSLEDAESAFRREYVLAVLKGCKYDQCKAALALGMHRNTLCRMLRTWGVDAAALKQLEKRHSLTEAEKLEVRAYVRANGRNARKVMAEKYGIGYGYIVRVCRGIGTASVRAVRQQQRVAFVDSIVPAVPAVPVRKVMIAGAWVDDPRELAKRRAA